MQKEKEGGRRKRETERWERLGRRTVASTVYDQRVPAAPLSCHVCFWYGGNAQLSKSIASCTVHAVIPAPAASAWSQVRSAAIRSRRC